MGGQQRVRGDVKCELGRKVFRAEGFEWVSTWCSGFGDSRFLSTCCAFFSFHLFILI